MASQSTNKVHIGTQTGNLEDDDDGKKYGMKYYEKEEKSDYEDLCTICLDKWTKKGKHMATRLTCGHIFGYRCIKRWVKIAHNCPLCKSISHKYQFRGVYKGKRSTWRRPTPL